MYEEVSKKLEEVDPGLSASVKADIQKDLNTELNRYQSNGPTKSEAGQTYEQAVQQWLKQIANNSNATVVSQIFDNMNSNVVMDNSNKNGSVVDIMNARMVRFPPALPLNMLPLVLRGSSLNQADIGLVVDAVFNSSGLSNVKIDCSSYIITATGNPTVSLHKSYNQLVAAIEKIPGLSDRVRVFLLPEYRIPLQTPSNRSMTEKYSNKRFEPVFIVLPKEAKPKPPKGWEYSAAAVSVLATAVTTFIFSTDVNALNAEFLQKALAGDTSVVNSVLAITAGIIGLQAMHDLGHFAASKAYNIKMSFPSFLLPSLQIGNFGSVTRFLDFPKNRKQLFDISIAGPLFGFVSSLLCFLSGVYMTSHASTEILSTFPELPAGFFKSSLLIYQLLESALHISTASSNIAGANGAGSLVPIHPLAIVGMVGLLSNALNFMPIGRLDGGRVAMAVGGRQSANDITFGTLLAQAISFVTSVNNPVQLFWIIAVVFLQRGSDHPPENDVTAIGDEEADGSKGIMWYGRLASLLFCMVLTAGILLPVPTDFSSITSSMNQFPPLNGPTI